MLRELITLADVVHDPARHPPNDDKIPSRTDARRKLEAYLAVELQGGRVQVTSKFGGSLLLTRDRC